MLLLSLNATPRLEQENLLVAIDSRFNETSEGEGVIAFAIFVRLRCEAGQIVKGEEVCDVANPFVDHNTERCRGP